MKNLANPPRNSIGDRAGPRYRLKTFQLALRACEPGPAVDSPQAAVPVLRQLLSRLDADQEHFIVLALNTIHDGGLHAARGHDLVAGDAELLGAASVILAHNHPSGVATPSAEDRALTRRLVACGDMLDLRVLDHMILGRGVYSMTEHGELR